MRPLPLLLLQRLCYRQLPYYKPCASPLRRSKVACRVGTSSLERGVWRQRRRVDLAFGPIEASPGSKVSGWPQAHGQGFLALCHRQVARAGKHRTGLDSVSIAGRAAPEGIAQAKALPMRQPATMAHQ